MTTNVELAHDLRMPLQLIYSSAQMLRLSARDGTVDAGAYLDMLMESVEQMRRMLEVALADGKPSERPRMVDADLVQCVRGLCRRCRPYADQAGVRLYCRGNAATLVTAFDEDMLSRILLNLISNALHFTPAGGRICVGWRAMGDFVEVCVSDTGAGIPPERVPYVFLWGESDGGHGYGLSISRRLARTMGGELTFRTQTGAGSAFTLRLPVRATARAEVSR